MLVTLIVLLGSLVVLILLSVPIFASLALSSMVAFVTTAHMPLSIFSQKFYSNVDTFPLLAVPFFLLTSAIMERSGISRRIVDLAEAVAGSIRGNLAVTGLLACVIFSAISGSSLATVSGVGGTIIPRMLKAGYSPRLAVGSVVAAGTLGILVPPSIPLIIYGLVTGTSVIKLFTAAIIPSILMAVCLFAATLIFAYRGTHAGTQTKMSSTERKKKLSGGMFTLLIPLGIFYGIYGIPGLSPAIFTPTEAAIVAVFLALIVGGLIYRDFGWRTLPSVISESSRAIGMIMLIVASAMLFSFVVNNADIPQSIAQFIVGTHMRPWMFLLVVNILLFLAGDFMDAVPIIMIFMPVLFPAAQSLGIDPVQFGIMTVVNMELGCITPPVGLNLFVASSIAKMGLYETLRASAPWIVVITIVLLLVTYIPGLTLWLPSLMHSFA